MLASIMLDTVAFTEIDHLAIMAIFFMVLFLIILGAWYRWHP